MRPYAQNPGPATAVDIIDPAKPTGKAKPAKRMPPADAGEVQAEGAFWVRVDRCRPMPNQPRDEFPEQRMIELRNGIKQEGQHTPAWVRRLSDAEKAADPHHDYEIIAGECRWRSVTALGWSHLLAIFKEPKNRSEQYLLAVQSNAQPLAHGALEILKQIKELLRNPELGHLSYSGRLEAIAASYTRSVGWVEYHLALDKLAPPVRVMIRKETLTVSMGAFLSTVADQTEQIHIADRALAEAMSVKQARAYAVGRATKKGYTVGARPRTARDDWRAFSSFLRRVSDEVDLLRGMEPNRFEQMFLSRSPSEQQQMLELLEANTDRQVEIWRALDRLKKKPK